MEGRVFHLCLQLFDFDICIKSEMNPNFIGFCFHVIAFYQSLRLDERADVAMQMQAMIDKTMNCTAIEREESAVLGYGDYMDSMWAIVFTREHRFKRDAII